MLVVLVILIPMRRDVLSNFLNARILFEKLNQQILTGRQKPEGFSSMTWQAKRDKGLLEPLGV